MKGGLQMKKKTKERISNALWLLALVGFGTSFLMYALIK